MTWTPISTRYPDVQKFLTCYHEEDSGDYVYCTSYLSPGGSIAFSSPWVGDPPIQAWMPLPSLDAPEWKSYPEYCPNYGEEVLAIYPPNQYDEETCIELATYRGQEDWLPDCELPYNAIGSLPTHWMPLPKMVKGANA
jgi:hypothetical protein